MTEQQQAELKATLVRKAIAIRDEEECKLTDAIMKAFDEIFDAAAAIVDVPFVPDALEGPVEQAFKSAIRPYVEAAAEAACDLFHGDD